MRIRPATVLLLALSLTIPLVAPRGLAANPEDAAARIRALEEEAEALVGEEELFRADRIYRKLHFATGSPAYAKELRSLGKKIADMVLEAVTDAEDAVSDEDAISLLNRAFEFDPGNSKLKKELQRRGCDHQNGAWRPKEANRAMAEGDAELSRSRRAELDLPEEMRIIREAPFRFFTDVPAGNQQLANMVKASRGVYSAYVERMRSFDLRYPEEGLDVVILTHEKDYRERTGSDSTAGLYVPRHGACYFYVSGNDVFQTLLHELIHQFNDKVAYFGETADCIEEGMAEWYGYAKLGGGMTRVDPGQANPSATRAMLDVIYERQTDFVYTPFPRFLEPQEDLEYDFYQQSWAFYTFLMETPDPRLRLALHDYLVATRRDGARLERLFESYGLPSVLVEQAFRDHWKKSRG